MKPPYTKYCVLNTTRQGFSLLELIIYTAILSVMMVVISNTFIGLLKGRGQAEARNEVNSAIRFATEQIRQDIKGASAVVTPTTSGSTLQMTVGVTPVTYDVLLGQLRRNDNGTIATTTSANIIVSTPIFTRLENRNATFDTTTTSVQVEMTFRYNSPSSGWTYSADLRTTISLRQATTAAPLFSATGGTITTSGSYTVHTFTNDETFRPSGSTQIEVILVGAGGSGFSCSDNCRSGGAAGGSVLIARFDVSGGESATITVPSGGVPVVGAYGTGAPGSFAQVYFSGIKFGRAGGGNNGTAGTGGSATANTIAGQSSTIASVLGGAGHGGDTYYGGGGGGAGGGSTGGRNYMVALTGDTGGSISNQPSYSISPGHGITVGTLNGLSTYISGGAGGGGGYGDSIVGVGQTAQPDRASAYSVSVYGASPVSNGITQHGGNGGRYGGGGGGGSHGSAGYGGSGVVIIRYLTS